MIVRLLRQIGRAGVRRAVVVVGYGGAEIVRALGGHGELGLAVEIVWNPNWQDGLASSVACGASAIDEPFLLVMADHVFDEEIVRQMTSVPVLPGGVVALVDARPGHEELSDAVRVRLRGDAVIDIGRHQDMSDGVDAGFFVATPALFGALEAVRSTEGAELADALQLLAKAGRVRAVLACDGQWNDVDLPVDVIRAEMRLRDRRRRGAYRGSPRAACEEPSEVFDFAGGAAGRTRVVVGRGFVRRPEELDLVPARSASSPVFVFTDETVNRLYGEQFVARLRASGLDTHAIVLPDGEESKTLANYVHLVERVLSRGVDERSVFISLGGGVVCNVCGFVASTIYRGLDLVHVPTTLMAQCDAAISHKQAINGHQGKNMVGSYYPPRLVAVDVEVLETLSARQIRDGLAEVAKHALAQEPSYVEMLLGFRGDLADRDFLEEVVRRNVRLKRELVRTDPEEHGDAAVLQYGHTFGHPVEHLSGYRLYHGESVAIGMMVAVRVARLLGACSSDLVRLHERLLGHLGLPTRAPASIRTADAVEALRFNKRHLTEGTRMALLSDVGRLWRVESEAMIPVSEQVLAQAFEATRGKDDAWLSA
jgi:3-dehydroquinate synthase